MMNKIIGFLVLIIMMTACEEHYIPKPRAYYRIAFPKKEYKTLRTPQFTFEILKSSEFAIKQADSSWTTVNYPPLNASLYLTFFHDKHIGKLSEDARHSAFKHAIKADDIITMPFAIPKSKVYGMIYSIEGNAASPAVFQFTDSVDQFVHGVVYFNCEPNADSLKPAINFVRQDIEHIIETFRWTSTSDNK